MQLDMNLNTIDSLRNHVIRCIDKSYVTVGHLLSYQSISNTSMYPNAILIK